MYTYSANKTPESLLPVLDELAQYYPMGREGAADGRLLHFVPSRAAGYAIDAQADGIVVHYADITAACRALGTLLATEEIAAGEAQCAFNEMGIMLDCSRNAVVRPDHFKCWIRRLALLGYNVAMHHQKPQGFETIQIRLSAQRTRIHELQVRLQEFLDGTVPAIPEFDENLRLVPDGPCPRGGFLGQAFGTAEV